MKALVLLFMVLACSDTYPPVVVVQPGSGGIVCTTYPITGQVVCN